MSGVNFEVTVQKRTSVMLTDYTDNGKYFLKLTEEQMNLLDWISDHIYGDFEWEKITADTFEEI